MHLVGRTVPAVAVERVANRSIRRSVATSSLTKVFPKSKNSQRASCIATGSVLKLDHDPLDLIEADLIAPAIIELRRAR